MRDYEILIKSFLRPDCVKRLIESIRKFYPDVTVRVCDDGDLKEVDGAILHKLPFYSGLAVGKNYLVQQVKTPYFVLLDDDFIVTSETDLDKLRKIAYSATDIAVVAGQIRENGEIKVGRGHLEVDYSEKYGRRLTRYYYGNMAPKISIAGTICIPCRMTSQIIMGNKELWNRYNIKWRDELKRAEHYVFFLDLPKQVRCYCVPEVIVDHKPDRSEKYDKYRNNDLYHRMTQERVMVFKSIYI